ncbi:glycosyltransferase family 2 protein [Cryobacterium tepidiphilum]|uniref:glycosyltransferase family 2 protein n=1 Tax=Cryobacterium tepidiphilum TaxID=2486026 RepID=UPI0013147E24|nr:glycosyltransferase [Cryobacterium tepidiphilum]
MTVVVPFFNVKSYLEECVDSILRQTLTDLEVILVDDGSTDGSHDIAARYVGKDKRVRLVAQANQGPGAARNAGVAHARGTYLTFVDSDDRLPPDALAILVDSARGNNANIAAGAIRRFNSTRSWVPAWAKNVHSDALHGVQLAQFPSLLRNNYPVAKVYKRQFWLSQELSFRTGVIYEDQPLIAQMLSRAGSINVVPDVVYDYRAREDRSSISQRPEEVKDLRDRTEAWQLTLDALRAEADAPVLEGWYETVYGTHFHWYLNNQSISDAGYWQILSTSAQSLLRYEPPGLLDKLSPEKRVAVRLLQENRHQAFLDFRESGGYELSNFGTRITPIGIEHSLPLSADAVSALPQNALVSFPEQLELRQEVIRGQWDLGAGPVQLRLSGFAYIDYVDLADVETRVELFATHKRSGEILAAHVEKSDDALLRPAQHPAGFDIDGSGYVASFELGGPTRLSLGSWTFSIRVTSGRFTVTEPLRNLSAKAGFVEEASRIIDDHVRIRVASNANRHVGVSLLVDEPKFIVYSVRSTGRDVTMAFRAGWPLPPTVMLSAGRTKLAHTRAHRGRDGNFQVSVTLPENESGRRRSWEVGVRDVFGRFVPLVCSAGLNPTKHSGIGKIHVGPTPTGGLRIDDCPHGYIRIEAVTALDDHSLEVSGDVHPAAGWSGYELECENAEIAAASGLTRDPLTVQGRFRADPLHPGGHPAVSTTVTGLAQGPDGRRSAVPVILGRGVLDELPLLVPGSGLIAQRAKGRSLSLRLTKASHSEGTRV